MVEKNLHQVFQTPTPTSCPCLLTCVTLEILCQQPGSHLPSCMLLSKQNTQDMIPQDFKKKMLIFPLISSFQLMSSKCSTFSQVPPEFTHVILTMPLAWLIQTECHCFLNLALIVFLLLFIFFSLNQNWLSLPLQFSYQLLLFLVATHSQEGLTSCDAILVRPAVPLMLDPLDRWENWGSSSLNDLQGAHTISVPSRGFP